MVNFQRKLISPEGSFAGVPSSHHTLSGRAPRKNCRAFLSAIPGAMAVIRSGGSAA